jgi:hypothetical protein
VRVIIELANEQKDEKPLTVYYIALRLDEI